MRPNFKCDDLIWYICPFSSGLFVKKKKSKPAEILWQDNQTSISYTNIKIMIDYFLLIHFPSQTLSLKLKNPLGDWFAGSLHGHDLWLEKLHSQMCTNHWAAVMHAVSKWEARWVNIYWKSTWITLHKCDREPWHRFHQFSKRNCFPI